MGVVMALATGTLLRLHGTYRTTMALKDAQAQAGRAFQRLDADLRYAAALRTGALPTVSPATPVLLYLVPGEVARCAALAVEGDRLVRRAWRPGAVPGPAEVLAARVAAPAAGPFTVTGAPVAVVGDGDSEGPPSVARPKSVTVALTVTAGTGRREVRANFVAANSAWGPGDLSLDDCVPA
jgi:hypothetical protein